MKFYKMLFQVFLIFCLAQIYRVHATPRQALFRTARSTFSPKYFSNFTLFAQNDTIYVDMHIIRQLKPGFKTYLDFQLRLSNSKKYQSLFAYHVDVCGMVINFKDTLFKKWFKSLMRFGNFMENCPVNTGHYYLNGWYLDSTLVPTYLYPGDYRIKGHGYYGKYKSKTEDFVVNCEVDTTIL